MSEAEPPVFEYIPPDGPPPLLPSNLLRIRNYLLPAAGAAIIVCIIGGYFNPQAIFRSWLYAWLFFLGISLGSLAMCMLHHMVGGEWGIFIRRIGESAALCLPLMAILFIPILINRQAVFPWARPDVLHSDIVLQRKTWWLNTPWFIGRFFIYFILWSVLAILSARWSIRFDRTADVRIVKWFKVMCGFGVLAYVVSMSLASVDWIMSREAHWYSTILGFLVTVSQTLSGLTFIVLILALFARRAPIEGNLRRNHLNDLGNLVLTLVILWAYMALAQFLVIWMGNLKEDNSWYLLRGLGEVSNGWRYLGLVLIIFHFIIPFFLLLCRYNKQNLRIFVIICAALLFMRLVDTIWLIDPSGPFPSPGGQFSWLDLFTPVAIGGIWFYVFIWFLQRRHLLVRPEPDDSRNPRNAEGPAFNAF